MINSLFGRIGFTDTTHRIRVFLSRDFSCNTGDKNPKDPNEIYGNSDSKVTNREIVGEGTLSNRILDVESSSKIMGDKIIELEESLRKARDEMMDMKFTVDSLERSMCNLQKDISRLDISMYTSNELRNLTEKDRENLKEDLVDLISKFLGSFLFGGFIAIVTIIIAINFGVL